MLTVHHLGVSASERIVWLCEELEIPYELVRYDREPAGGAPAEYKALHPSGTAPVVTDGDITLAESGAVIDYIIAKYGQGRLALGPESPDFADYLFWLHYANGSFVPAVVNRIILSRVAGAADNPVAKAMGAREERAYAAIAARLAQAPYFAGNAFTAADIMMFFR